MLDTAILTTFWDFFNWMMGRHCHQTAHILRALGAYNAEFDKHWMDVPEEVIETTYFSIFFTVGK